MTRYPILAALALAACGTNESPAAQPMPDSPTAEGSGETTAFEPEEAPPAPPSPQLPADEPADAPPTVASTVGGQTRLELSPAWEVGDTVRREVRWGSESRVTISHDGRDVSSSIVGSVDAVIEFTVSAADKGAAQTIELRFESVDREASGAPTTLQRDPEPGAVWTCYVDSSPVICAVSPEERSAPPEWLVFAFDALLPSRSVTPGEAWSRRLGVARALALGEDGAVRATVRAEAPYENADGLYSTCTFEFEGEDVTQALGRTARLTLSGEGAFEFDLRRRRVTAFDASWTGRAVGHRMNGTAYRRETETTVRVTELPTGS